MNVSAKDKATGREQTITITASTNLSDNDIERMVKEAEQNRADDERRLDVVRAVNEADTLIYQAEKALTDLGEQVPMADQEDIRDQIESLRQAMNNEDLDSIRGQVENLRNVVNALSQQANTSQTQANPNTEPDDEIVEGEFSEV